MIDLHSHLLPGIDDGPSTMEQSIELCRLAVNQGITHSIATPHIHPGRWQNDRSSIGKAYLALRDSLSTLNIPLQLGFAAEVRLTEAIIQQVAMDEIPFYGVVDGYKVMLLEFPHSHITAGSNKLVSWLLENGIRPLIAHPERNKQVIRNPNVLDQFLEAGCWLQFTAASVTGYFGDGARQAAERLLASGTKAVIATDSHNGESRPPLLREALEIIAREHGPETIERLSSLSFEIVADQFQTKSNRVLSRAPAALCD